MINIYRGKCPILFFFFETLIVLELLYVGKHGKSKYTILLLNCV